MRRKAMKNLKNSILFLAVILAICLAQAQTGESLSVKTTSTEALNNRGVDYYLDLSFVNAVVVAPQPANFDGDGQGSHSLGL